MQCQYVGVARPQIEESIQYAELTVSDTNSPCILTIATLEVVYTHFRISIGLILCA